MSSKSREEYLIEFENKLIDSLKDLYKSINETFVLLYSLSIFITLFEWGTFKKVSFLGADIDINGLNMFLILPTIIATIYTIINYQMIIIGSLYRNINANANEILLINAEAKPITIKDIHLFGVGMMGLVSSLYRWLAYRLFIKNPFKQHQIFLLSIRNIISFINRAVVWAITLLIITLIITSVFYLPLALAAYYVYMKFLQQNPVAFNTPIILFIFILTTIMLTFISGIFLFLSYLIDLMESFKQDVNKSIEEVFKYYTVVKHIVQTVDILIRF